MSRELEKFVPSELIHEPVEMNDSMSLIVDRISEYLAPEQVWEHFSSSPSSTGGVRRFPYYRVDTGLLCCRDSLLLIEDSKQKSLESERKFYQRASNFAMEVVLWVEVGFGGLQNLAVHSASKNWTSGVGHFVNDEQRAQLIMTNGKEFYDSVMRSFVSFREVNQIANDCFTKIKLEPVLEKWR
jgi:hypothetical protein